jgi:hypothetical protein
MISILSTTPNSTYIEKVEFEHVIERLIVEQCNQFELGLDIHQLPSCVYPFLLFADRFRDVPLNLISDGIRVSILVDQFVRAVDNSYDEKENDPVILHHGILQLTEVFLILSKHEKQGSSLVEKSNMLLKSASDAELRLHARRGNTNRFDEIDRSAKLHKHAASLIPFVLISNSAECSTTEEEFSLLLETCVYLAQTIDDVIDAESDLAANRFSEIICDWFCEYPISDGMVSLKFLYCDVAPRHIRRALEQLSFRCKAFRTSSTYNAVVAEISSLLMFLEQQNFGFELGLVRDRLKAIPTVAQWG